MDKIDAPTVQLKLSVPADKLRNVLRACHEQRDQFPTYNHVAIDAAAPWMPLVHCLGIHYAVIVPTVTAAGAAAILEALTGDE